MRFDGQPILISGAGRGLGEAIAKHLAAEGAVVGVADINERSAHDVTAAIHAAGGRVITEAEQSCVVYGMPRVVKEAGLAETEARLEDMAVAIARLL